jgi:hypothetical protein
MTRLLNVDVYCRGASVLFYPAALPLSRQTLAYVSGVIRRHRAQIGSPWRKLPPGRQALLALAYLRQGETFAGLAAGFGNRHRHRLAVRDRNRGAAGCPVPETAQGAAGRPADRARVGGDRRDVKTDRPGGGRPAVLLRQAPPPRHEPASHRQPRWRDPVVSGPLPGAVHDLSAARIWGITRELARLRAGGAG